MIEMFLGSLTWHLPRTEYTAHSRRPQPLCGKKIPPSSADKPLIGPAHSPGNKGAGPPRQKVQTERLIGPLTAESGRPARAASTRNCRRRVSRNKQVELDTLELNFILYFFETLLCFSTPSHTTYPREIRIITLYHYTLYFFHSATFSFWWFRIPLPAIYYRSVHTHDTDIWHQ